MKRFGLLGKTLSHSFSKRYFTEKFNDLGLADQVYELFELPSIEDFPSLIKANSPLSGMNVTIPYKEKVIPFLTELDNSALNVGAVNCIKFLDDGSLKGYNTDVYGFTHSLLNTLEKYQMPMPKSALILGTGGAAKAVIAAFKDLNIEYYSVSRTLANADFDYSSLTKEVISQNLLIINASPVGTFPNVGEMPSLPYDALSKHHLLFDLVYNPSTTSFMKRGEEFGAKSVNGLEMLHLQAEKAWEIWNQ